MTSNEILSADMLDILFDNRNKQYGAYKLRRNYNHNMLIGLGSGIGSVFLALMFLKAPLEEVVKKTAPYDAVVLRDYKIPAEKLPEPQKLEKRHITAIAPVAQKRGMDRIEIVPDEKKLLQEFPSPDALKDMAISDRDITGKPGIISAPRPIVGATGNGGPAKTESKPPLVQKEPEFPGGLKAWIAFLNRNLQVPGELEAGEKKTVLIRFLVATDGAVTGFEVLRSGGNIYDNEVIRVLKKMPKWKPAIQNNQPVSRSFTQPVTFIGLEE